jgi:hypothetical protein
MITGNRFRPPSAATGPQTPAPDTAVASTQSPPPEAKKEASQPPVRRLIPTQPMPERRWDPRQDPANQADGKIPFCGMFFNRDPMWVDGPPLRQTAPVKREVPVEIVDDADPMWKPVGSNGWVPFTIMSSYHDDEGREIATKLSIRRSLVEQSRAQRAPVPKPAAADLDDEIPF